MTDEEGKKRIALVGKWNSYLDMQKCDEEGTPLPGAELVRLWTVRTVSLLHALANCTGQLQCSMPKAPVCIGLAHNSTAYYLTVVRQQQQQ